MAYDKHNENRGQWFMRSPMGRVAGDGILSDDYSEESGGKEYWVKRRGKVRFPNDNRDNASLNGECIIVQKGKKV